ncbi:hypothetical protein NQZ68_020728 [Dissostichus eleginoides]|nr:hypothetical protein NQZ68_020728 [Dissostichus eleginoides]
MKPYFSCPEAADSRQSGHRRCVKIKRYFALILSEHQGDTSAEEGEWNWQVVTHSATEHLEDDSFKVILVPSATCIYGLNGECNDCQILPLNPTVSIKSIRQSPIALCTLVRLTLDSPQRSLNVLLGLTHEIAGWK